MPRLSPVLLLAALALPAAAETNADRFAPQRGLNTETWVDWLSVEEMLREPGFLDHYPNITRHVTPEMLAGIRPLGFDFVRLGADPAPLLALGPGEAQDRLIARTVETVQALQATGLKVIVDLHSIPRADEGWGTESIVADPEVFAAHVALTGRYAAALAKLDPARTALEVLNEPTHDCGAIYGSDAPVWPDQLRALLASARAEAPDLPVVLSGACWGGVDGLEALDPTTFGDDNVLWSFHSYDPFLFTHQGAGWTYGASRYFGALPYPPELLDDARAADLLAAAEARLAAQPLEGVTPETLREELRLYRETPVETLISAEIDAAAAWADRHGIPRGRLIMGEFGAIRDGAPGMAPEATERARFLADKRGRAEAQGIGWAVWDWGGSMGIVDDDRLRKVNPLICTALGLTGCDG